MKELANLDFYTKEIENIQQQLLDKLDNLVSGLQQLSDTELIQIAKQIDFFEEMDKLGYGKLINKVGQTYDDEIAKIYAQLSEKQLESVPAASIQTLTELKNFELDYLRGNAKQYAEQLKTAMLRGIITGETNRQIINRICRGFGVGRFRSSSEASFLLNDAFATFSNATRSKAYEEFPEIKFIYSGTLDKATRGSCRYILNNNKPRTQKEIQELEVPEQADGSQYFGFSRRGGYNCRHDWIRYED